MTEIELRENRKRLERALRLNEIRLIMTMKESIIASRPEIDRLYVRREFVSGLIGIAVAVASGYFTCLWILW